MTEIARNTGVNFPTHTAVTPAPANPSREKIPGSSHHQGRANSVPTIPEIFETVAKIQSFSGLEGKNLPVYPREELMPWRTLSCPDPVNTLPT